MIVFEEVEILKVIKNFYQIKIIKFHAFVSLECGMKVFRGNIFFQKKISAYSLTVADPGFSWGQLPKWVDFAHLFCRKLQKMKESGPQGGRDVASLLPPWIPH